MGEWLLIMLLIPVVGAIICALLPQARLAKHWTLGVTLVTFLLSVVIALCYFMPDRFFTQPPKWSFGDEGTNLFSLVGIPFRFSLKVDSISIWLILLTTFLQPLAMLASFDSIKDREKEYYTWMLLLLASMLGVFVARDLLLFYIFFELTLIPMFFIIGIWGGAERRYAAGKFFLYTFTGGVLTLAGIIYLASQANSFDIGRVVSYAQNQMTDREQFWIFLALLAGFAVKVPLFPVHTWLPLAHTEAPTAGSVILAGVLLKLGTYGLLRVAVPAGLMGLPDGSTSIADGAILFPKMIKVLGALCVIAVIYAALVAWVQRDIKKLVAYSSVSHLGFCVLGMLALNQIGMQGSVMYMINHGLSTGAMFLCIGMIYDRYHTREISRLSGLGRVMPKLAFFFVLFTMSSIGLPGTNGFVSEFLTILGTFTSDYLGMWFAIPAATGVVLGAIYMLHLAASVVFGPLKVPTDHGHGTSGAHSSAHSVGHGDSHGHTPVVKNDIGAREITVLAPIAVLVIVLGVLPSFVLQSMKAPLEELRVPKIEEIRDGTETRDRSSR